MKLDINFKNALKGQSAYAALGIAALLLIAILFIFYVRFLYSAINSPFNLSTAADQGSGDLLNFRKADYDFVLKNLGIVAVQETAAPVAPPAASSTVPATTAPQSTAAPAPAQASPEPAPLPSKAKTN